MVLKFIELSTIIFASFLLSACVTLPAQYEYDARKTFNTSSDIVWSALMEYFTANNIHIKTIEKDSGVIYAERIYAPTSSTDILGEALEGLADCGKAELLKPLSSTVSLNVFVRDDLKIEKTTVNINVVFSQECINLLNAQVGPVMCNSTGLLEQNILNHIELYIVSHEVMEIQTDTESITNE